MCTCKDVGFMIALEPHGHGKSFRFMECTVLVNTSLNYNVNFNLKMWEKYINNAKRDGNC